jgi:hypothetical protein
MGRPLFAAAKATGAAFTRGTRCAHMRAAGSRRGTPRPEAAPPKNRTDAGRTARP